MIRARRAVWIAFSGVVGVALLFGAGCRTTAPAEGAGGDVLHHHNWWNYYTRGVSRLTAGEVVEARADFQRALGEISGATFGEPRDMWRARTYGLHFVEGYFPNRELGVCLLLLARADEAIPYLERSLQQAPSGRAKHYLNQARQALLSEGEAVGPLRVRVTGQSGASAPGGVPITRQVRVPLVGTVSGPARVKGLAVAGVPDFIELAPLQLDFTRSLTLREGLNEIELKATDLLDRTLTQTFAWVADWRAPSVAVMRVERQGSAWSAELVCRDAHGVAHIEVQGGGLVAVPPEGAERVAFSVRIPDTGSTQIRATDRAGNVLRLALDAKAVAVALDPARTARVAAAGGAGWESTDALTALPAQAAPAEADRLRPTLTMRGIKQVSRVFDEAFFVDGTAADGSGLAAITVNGENLLASEDQGALRSYFSRRLPLDPGTNRFEVAAIDRAGNRAVSQLTVIRVRSEFLDEAYRLSVGVPPLTPESAGSLRERVKRAMESELLREPVRFRLLERDEGWDYILREQGLSLSDLADPAASLRVGKLLPAELLLLGTVIPEAKGVTLYVKAVETTTAAVIFGTDVYSADPERGLEEQVAGLIMKVEHGFPLVTGEVLKQRGAQLTLNVGSDDGVFAGSRFIVVHPGAADGGLASGQVIKADGRALDVAPRRVRSDSATATVVPSHAGDQVSVGDYVYAR